MSGHFWLRRRVIFFLSVSGSEVDVERLFSGCGDEFGIRRRALKADTVRLLTLLRSAYTQEDKINQKLIKAGVETISTLC